MPADPTLCRRCGETLQLPVPFCPFCGLAQNTTAAEPRLPPAPRMPEPVRPKAPAPVATPPPAPMAAPRVPVVPPVQPTPRRAPEPALSVSPPPPVQPPRSRPPPPSTPSSSWGSPPRRPAGREPRRLSAAARASRAAAIRKLLLAAVILVCAVILWQHLTAGPHGTLRVHLSRPVEGRVLVDGVAAGNPDEPIPVEPGRHAIGFEAAGWSTTPLSVNLRDRETTAIELSPVARRARLSIDSLPAGASLSVGGKHVGRAPTTLPLPPGTYRVGAVLPGFEATEQRVSIEPGDQRTLTLTLRPVPLRTLHLRAPVGGWSDPMTLPSGSHFTVLFRSPIRMRAGGRVVLLEGGAAADLGALDQTDISFTAVGDDPVPVELLIRSVGTPG